MSLPDGSTRLPDGRVRLPNGAHGNWEGGGLASGVSWGCGVSGIRWSAWPRGLFLRLSTLWPDGPPPTETADGLAGDWSPPVPPPPPGKWALAQPDGSMLLSDGSSLMPDGTIRRADGTIVYGDGAVHGAAATPPSKSAPPSRWAPWGGCRADTAGWP